MGCVCGGGGGGEGLKTMHTKTSIAVRWQNMGEKYGDKKKKKEMDFNSDQWTLDLYK